MIDIAIDDAIAEEIEALIGSLDDDDRFLNQARNRVGISFNQMLAYIAEFEETVTGPQKKDTSAVNEVDGVKVLLETYVEMAKKYYAQYLCSVLQEIDTEANLQKKLNGIISGLGNFKPKDDSEESRDEAGDEAVDLLKELLNASAEKENSLKKEFPVELQRGFERLEQQWHHVYRMASAYQQAFAVAEDVMNFVSKLIKYIALSMGITNVQIVVVPGTDFSLSFFGYLDNFAVLTVPLYSVQSPFEWSIFWHELAGHRVRELKKVETREAIKNKLRQFSSLCQEDDFDAEQVFELLAGNNLFYDNGFDLTSSYPGELAERIRMRKNEFTEDHLRKLFSKKDKTESYLQGIGSFEQIFESSLDELLAEGRQIYDKAKVDGWCVDWIEELFEDAWSVIAIREEFLEYIEDVLRRKNALGDSRHPSVETRISVAREIILLMNPNSEIQNNPSDAEKIVARRILEFISLLLAAAFQDEYERFKTRNSNMQHGGIIEEQKAYRQVADFLSSNIGMAIHQWMNDTRMVVAPDAGSYLQSFSAIAQLGVASMLKGREYAASRTPSITRMLGDKDHHELLKMDFVEQDFLSSHLIIEIKLNSNLQAKNTPFTAIHSSVRFILPRECLNEPAPGTESTAGEIRFKIGKNHFYTTRRNWNDAFRSYEQYQIDLKPQ